jgi:hypothetical protein
MVIADLLLTIDDQDAIELHDIRVVVAELVSGSVAADNYILGHKDLPGKPGKKTLLHLDPIRGKAIYHKQDGTRQKISFCSGFVTVGDAADNTR